MDYISVVDLEVYAFHGVLEEEKKQGQTFLISFDAYLDLETAGAEDDLGLSVSYASMCYTIEDYFKSEKYNLIETLAEGVAKSLLTTYDLIRGIKVTVKKPHAPIGRPFKCASVTVERYWHEAYIAIGSNMGKREEILLQAIEAINVSGHSLVEKVSELRETKPWGYIDQEDFINGVIRVKTLLSPRKLMEYLLDIEKTFKREREIHWGPRTLDLDLIFYDNLVTEDEKVVLPHPRMAQRRFVLKPLSELAPFKVHPLLKKRVIDLLAELEMNEVSHS
ncbi:2-amino-4-hydroxy-6-hydroxymethyldihydropteridine diphosphokinase [Petrocella sp. FN5]|uniref:2-amino-4-hydroxy-6- hydroxymethyldihydropteridine diphosphokinase n=1 Tax=Petrocella sp. FN5 TaxID=3032002 RepID=UPI0023D9B6EC|nr:2-amino-4-hydroxy-6-hydroxymethyldihydropteridine diphosphokinase [Petrocella sp. FN5]MDF1617079.1 2-amino-4-hydroxy-6-hydroxymethyldihydropteridine diphosphokinase [Petrocella sp. FN5]